MHCVLFGVNADVYFGLSLHPTKVCIIYQSKKRENINHYRNKFLFTIYYFPTIIIYYGNVRNILKFEIGADSSRWR